MTNTFKKIERLCSQKSIGRVFAQGEVVVKYPFRAVFLVEQAQGFPPCKVLVSVSKKRFKRANMRNLIKRRIREAYRRHKDALYQNLDENNVHLTLALIYLPKEELEFASIEKGIVKLMDKLMAHMQRPQNLIDGDE